MQTKAKPCMHMHRTVVMRYPGQPHGDCAASSWPHSGRAEIPRPHGGRAVLVTCRFIGKTALWLYRQDYICTNTPWQVLFLLIRPENSPIRPKIRRYLHAQNQCVQTQVESVTKHRHSTGSLHSLETIVHVSARRRITAWEKKTGSGYSTRN